MQHDEVSQRCPLYLLQPPLFPWPSRTRLTRPKQPTVTHTHSLHTQVIWSVINQNFCSFKVK